MSFPDFGLADIVDRDAENMSRIRKQYLPLNLWCAVPSDGLNSLLRKLALISAALYAAPVGNAVTSSILFRISV